MPAEFRASRFLKFLPFMPEPEHTDPVAMGTGAATPMNGDVGCKDEIEML